MEKIIIANHKMNMSLDETKKFIKEIKKANFKHIIFPSSLYLPYYTEEGINVGIQNIYYEEDGSYTGEISASQVKSLGVKYAMIGHSERRRIFNETDEDINLKVKKALEHDLKVILCIGDNIGQHYKEVLKEQIKKGLDGVNEEVIISYEPVYSIGTGLIADKDELNEIIKYIKSLFNYDVKVFYGGSVNLKNADELRKIEGISGYLIATSSLDVSEFIKIGEVLK